MSQLPQACTYRFFPCSCPNLDGGGGDARTYTPRESARPMAFPASLVDNPTSDKNSPNSCVFSHLRGIRFYNALTSPEHGKAAATGRSLTPGLLYRKGTRGLRRSACHVCHVYFVLPFSRLQ